MIFHLCVESLHYCKYRLIETVSGRATSIAYVGPSVSPYYDLNLGYRIYYVDGDHDATTRVFFF